MADPLALQSHLVAEEVQAVLTAGAPDLQGALVVQAQVALEIFQITLAGVGRMQPATILFGLFVLVGGVMGYKKKRSKDSLIASSIIAGLLLFSAYLMGKPNTTYGVRLAMVTTGTLAAYMGKGYYDKRKVFPQGVLAVLSSLMTVAYWGSVKQL